MKRKQVLWSITAFLWIVLFFLVIEGTGHVFYQVLPAKSDQYDNDRLFRSVREAFHPQLWKKQWETYEPGTSARMVHEGENCDATINSFGFRGPELPGNRDGARIIACLGGSTTVLGNRNETTYPYRMGVELHTRHGIDASVINCGISGLQSRHYVATAERLLRATTPELVIEYNAVNDIILRIFSPARKRLPGWKHFLIRSTTMRLFLSDSFVLADEVLRQEIDTTITDNLLQLARYLRNKGSRLAVSSFLYPDPELMSWKQYLHFDQNIRFLWRTDVISYRRYCRAVDIYNRRIRQLSEEGKFLYIPLAESIQLSNNDFQDICHLDEGGVAVMAKTMADLVANLIEPAEIIRPQKRSQAAQSP